MATESGQFCFGCVFSCLFSLICIVGTWELATCPESLPDGRWVSYISSCCKFPTVCTCQIMKLVGSRQSYCNNKRGALLWLTCTAVFIEPMYVGLCFAIFLHHLVLLSMFIIVNS